MPTTRELAASAARLADQLHAEPPCRESRNGLSSCITRHALSGRNRSPDSLDPGDACPACGSYLLARRLAAKLDRLADVEEAVAATNAERQRRRHGLPDCVIDPRD